DTLANMRTLDRWRAAIGVVYEPEKPENRNLPVHGRPLAKRSDARMTYGRIPGLDRDVARMVMGGDNQSDYRLATVMFDDSSEQLRHRLDTARIYMGGLAEVVLGKWIRSRGIRKDIIVLTKGAHTPFCYPDKMNEQFAKSLGELQTDYTDIYMLHRDNLEVPV